MGGIRIGGSAVPSVTVGMPFTAQSASDFQYIGLGANPGNAIEVTDKLVNILDEANNVLVSPNGQWLVVNANSPNPPDDGTIQVIASSAVGGTPTIVTPAFPFPDPDNGYRLHPFWHPDNDTIVYVKGRDGFQGDIETVQRSAPGTATSIYANPDVTGATGHGVYRPQYNRDGTKLAWIRHKNAAPTDGGNGLYVCDADGSGLTQIDDMGAGSDGYLFEGSQFQWGPGDIIVYIDGSDEQLYKINADGTGKTLLSSDVESSAALCRVCNRCFSPDDSFIIGTALTSNNFGGSWDLWRWELDGSGGTWIDINPHGPDGDTYHRCAYVHQDGRVYMIESKSTGSMISCLPDGTDERTDVDLGVNADGTQFFDGTGIEWI